MRGNARVSMSKWRAVESRSRNWLPSHCKYVIRINYEHQHMHIVNDSPSRRIPSVYFEYFDMNKLVRAYHTWGILQHPGKSIWSHLRLTNVQLTCPSIRYPRVLVCAYQLQLPTRIIHHESEWASELEFPKSERVRCMAVWARRTIRLPNCDWKRRMPHLMVLMW